MTARVILCCLKSDSICADRFLWTTFMSWLKLSCAVIPTSTCPGDVALPTTHLASHYWPVTEEPRLVQFWWARSAWALTPWLHWSRSVCLQCGLQLSLLDCQPLCSRCTGPSDLEVHQCKHHHSTVREVLCVFFIMHLYPLENYHKIWNKGHFHYYFFAAFWTMDWSGSVCLLIIFFAIIRYKENSIWWLFSNPKNSNCHCWFSLRTD